MLLSKLQVASLNVRGLSDRIKRHIVFDLFKKSSYNIICLQETKSQFRDENQIRKDWHNKKIFINSSKKENSCGGTMILFNSDSICILDTVMTPDGGCIAIDIEVEGNRFHVINTYFPEDNKKNSFILSLYPLISSQYPIIWAGDFNLAPDPKKDRFPPRANRDAHSYEFELLKSTFNLSDVCRELYPNKTFFSFRRGQSKSRIDHFYTSRNIIVESYQHHEFSSSDHDIISMKLILSNNLINRGKGYWKNRTKLYESEQFLENFEKFWDENLKENNKRSIGSWWVETKFQIKRFLIKMNNEIVESKQEEIKNAKLLLEREKFLSTLHPDNVSINRKYFKCKEELARKQIAEIKDRIIHDKLSELQKGDMPTKKFFEKLKRLKSNQEPEEIYKKMG